MKKAFYIAVLIGFIACVVNRDPEGNPIHFYPRKCEYVMVESFRSYPEQSFGEAGIVILTSNHDIRTEYDPNYMRDEPIASLQDQITEAYRNQACTRSGAKEENIVFIEYRTTGITAMKIVSVDAELFGIPATGSLNECFDIVSYYPELLISYETQSLITGFCLNEMPVSISEWLAAKPMAQPSMGLRPNRGMNAPLPLSTRFAVELITVGGTVLRDTTQMLTIQ